MRPAGSGRAFLVVACVATVPLLALPFATVAGTANYRYAFAFLLPILWGTFLARRALLLHPFHFALFALALILHNLGALGYYTRTFLGLLFDTYVHFYFGLVGGLVLERALRAWLGLSGWRAWIFVPVFLLGLGALHEIVEAGSTLVLGREVGMFKLDDVDQFDTHKDLLNNALGALCGLGLAHVARRVRRSQRG
jgi:uncharacterized membrane protein YjdF